MEKRIRVEKIVSNDGTVGNTKILLSNGQELGGITKIEIEGLPDAGHFIIQLQLYPTVEVDIAGLIEFEGESDG